MNERWGWWASVIQRGVDGEGTAPDQVLLADGIWYTVSKEPEDEIFVDDHGVVSFTTDDRPGGAFDEYVCPADTIKAMRWSK